MFDPALADEAVVVRDGARWRLDVLRFTGDLLASVPLHVDGPFEPRVRAMATRLLDGWNVEATASWDANRSTWTAPLGVASDARRLRTPSV
jgi:hypothetical protein